MSEHKPFAKLFEHETLGQILVRRERDNDDDKPGLRITFDPCVEALAPCDIFIGVGGVNEDAAETAADRLFASVTPETAAKIVELQIKEIRQMFPSGSELT